MPRILNFEPKIRKIQTLGPKNAILSFLINILVSRPFQLVIYTAFHEESESEVEKCQNLEPVGKNRKNLP